MHIYGEGFILRHYNKYIVHEYYILFLITGGKTPDIGSRTYTEIMREQMFKGEEAEVKFKHLTNIIYKNLQNDRNTDIRDRTFKIDDIYFLIVEEKNSGEG